MSKKHFIALADAIKQYNRNGPAVPFNEDQIAWLAGFCLDQNGRFNRQRWLDYIAGECGPNGGRV